MTWYDMKVDYKIIKESGRENVRLVRGGGGDGGPGSDSVPYFPFFLSHLNPWFPRKE